MAELRAGSWTISAGSVTAPVPAGRHINQQVMCGRAVWELPDSAIRSQTRTNSLAVAAAPQNRHVWLSSGWEPPAWQEVLGGLNQNFISILSGWIMTFYLFLFYSDLGPVFQYFSAFDPRNSVICEQTHHLSTNSSGSSRASLCSVTFPMKSTFFLQFILCVVWLWTVMLLCFGFAKRYIYCAVFRVSYDTHSI